ncbi:MAG: hypothetical protein V2J25_13230 [Desulfatiglans sp.]|nr:hypothetical protein [Thermodesulfobacteriota bacterium]MEE4353817.1 hypothetical protein [Desulfatiglans sp.]
MWTYREQLNYYGKLRRSLYEILRDTLERRLMKISLIDSFYNYQKNGVEYRFLDKSELKPKSKTVGRESDLFKTFIVIFCEGVVNPHLKNYIRFFPENSLVKKNLEYFPDFTLYRRFHQNLRHFESPGFLDFVNDLLDIDYALLIQQDPTVKKKNRYSLTHFHVKIDWPIADAAEDLAKWLRYIQNNLYENTDREGRILQNKLFEYYGCHHSVGGRRTAGLIAAQLLRKLDFISTVFVSSSESRSMYKYSERGVSKFFLIQLTRDQVRALAQKEGMKTDDFESAYLYPAWNFHVGISEASYGPTVHSQPPYDGRLRKLKPAYNWLRLRSELLHPRIEALDSQPISYDWVYTST